MDKPDTCSVSHCPTLLTPKPRAEGTQNCAIRNVDACTNPVLRKQRSSGSGQIMVQLASSMSATTPSLNGWYASLLRVGKNRLSTICDALDDRIVEAGTTE